MYNIVIMVVILLSFEFFVALSLGMYYVVLKNFIFSSFLTVFRKTVEACLDPPLRPARSYAVAIVSRLRCSPSAML